MIRTAEQTDRRLGVIFQSRFKKPILRIKQLIEEGRLGELLHISGYVKWYRPQEYYEANDWRGRVDREGGGVVFSQAGHTLDLMQWIGGPVEWVFTNMVTAPVHQGIEIENLFQVNENLRLELSATYLDSTFDEIENPQLSYLVDRDTPRAPTWAGVAAFRYDWQIAGDWGVYVRGLASYTGSHFVGADVPSEEKVGSYVIADATIGVSGPDERWEASIWCGNSRSRMMCDDRKPT